MEKHVTIVGALRIGMSVLFILLAVFLFVLLFGVGIISNDQTAMAVLTTIGAIIGIFMVLLGLPGLIGGIGLLRWKNWARILTLVVSALDLVNVPIGTALGIYSIWALPHDETAELFRSAEAE